MGKVSLRRLRAWILSEVACGRYKVASHCFVSDVLTRYGLTEFEYERVRNIIQGVLIHPLNAAAKVSVTESDEEDGEAQPRRYNSPKKSVPVLYAACVDTTGRLFEWELPHARRQLPLRFDLRSPHD